MTASLRRCLVLTFMMGVVCSSSLRADYKVAYLEGYQLARQDRDWEIVAQKMADALKENDREGETLVLTSANTQPYLPYFYLGLARFKLGDCRGALANWIKSSHQKKVVLHGRERDWFNQYLPICQHVVWIEDTFEQIQSRLPSIDELARDADLGKIWNQDAAFGPALAKLRQRIEQVRQNIQQARAAKIDQQQGLLLSVEADANDLWDQTKTLLKTARERRDDLVAQRLANEKRLAEERKPARETTTAGNNANNGTTSGGTGNNGTAGGGAGNSGGNSSTTSGSGGTPSLVTRPLDTKAVEAKPTAPLAPPDALRAVAQLYVKGQYREARDGLQSLAVPAEWRANAALLHAASAFSLYYAEGQKDRRLLDEAIRAVQTCAQANHDLRPSRRLFAPPFIEFFDRHAGPRQAARAARAAQP